MKNDWGGQPDLSGDATVCVNGEKAGGHLLGRIENRIELSGHDGALLTE